MPTAAQQYVLIQEQMQREAMLVNQPQPRVSQKPSESWLALDHNQGSPIPPNSTSTNRFTALRGALSFSSYPSRDSMASPIPPTVGGSQFIRQGFHPEGGLKNEVSSYSRFDDQKASINGISSSVLGDPLSASPLARQAPLEKHDFVVKQSQALRAVELAADAKRQEVRTKEAQQRYELYRKFDKFVNKLEKGKQKLAAKLKALEDKNEIKALKRECRRDLSSQQNSESQETSATIINPFPRETPLSTTSGKSNSNISFRTSSFLFETPTTASPSFSTFSFSKKKRNSFVDPMVTNLASSVEEPKKKHVLAVAPPFPFAAPKYVSKNEEKEILVQPMSFAPPQRKSCAAHGSKRIIVNAKESAVGEPLTKNKVATTNLAEELVATVEIPSTTSQSDKAKSNAFLIFKNKEKKQNKKNLKNKQKDDMIVRGSLAAFGNTKRQITVDHPESLALSECDANPNQSTLQTVDGAHGEESEAVCQSAKGDNATLLPKDEEARAPKHKLSYFAKRSKIRQQQIYRQNNYLPSKRSNLNVRQPSELTTAEAQPISGKMKELPVRNLTNIMYTSYYKAPKYVPNHEEKVVMSQPTGITFAEQTSKKKQCVSKWEADDARALYVFTQSMRRATILAEQEARDEIHADYMRQVAAQQVTQEPIVQTPCHPSVEENIEAKEEVVPVIDHVAVASPTKASKNAKKSKNKKKFWHMFNCSKKSAVKMERE